MVNHPKDLEKRVKRKDQPNPLQMINLMIKKKQKKI